MSSHPERIPAAAIDGIDLDLIRATDPGRAAEVVRIAKLLDVGLEEDGDVARLAELLTEVGEAEFAELFLRRNLEPGLASHDVYVRLFGDGKEREFREAVRGFCTQFDAILGDKVEFCFLHLRYSVQPEAGHPILASAQAVVFDYDHINCPSVVVLRATGGHLALRWCEKTWVSARDGDELPSCT